MKKPLLLVACLVLLFALAGIAWADGEITVVQDKVTAKFQEQITFALEAKSATSDISRITLYYQLGNQPVTSYAYPKFDPGRTVKSEHVWDTKKSYVPPGVTLTYYYLIEDGESHQLKTAPKTFLYTDTRHTWRAQGSGPLSLNWYQGTDSFGQALFDAAKTGLAQLEKDAGITVRLPVSIWIYPSYDELRGSMEKGAKEWTGGVSYSDMGVILIGVPEDRLSWGKRAVAHELSHVVIDQATQNPFGDLPRWLNEGLAMYAEGPLESEYSTSVSRAAQQDKLLSLKTLSSNFPSDSAQATLSYAESYSVVKYLIDTYGRDKMAQLLGVFKEGSTYDGALRKTYGLTTDELDTAWRSSLGIKSQPAPTATPRPRVTPAPTQESPFANLPGLPGNAVILALCLGGGCLVVATLALALIVYLAMRSNRRR